MTGRSLSFLGVITFSSNENTSHLVRQMFAAVQLPLPCIILETDAPFMIPANIYGSLLAVVSAPKEAKSTSELSVSGSGRARAAKSRMEASTWCFGMTRGHTRTQGEGVEVLGSGR